MDVVYLYCEFGSTRVPFYDFDRRLFDLLKTRGGGVWNSTCNEVIFGRNIDVEKLSRFLPCTPIVQVKDNSPDQPSVFNFFDRPWDIKVKAEKPINDISVVEDKVPSATPCLEYSETKTFSAFVKESTKQNKAYSSSPFSFPKPPSLPERFSEHWQSRLETELRARKYSPQTRRAYIYYNRLICRTLQKPPEEISPEDVTQFLATMEKSKEYSASSLNLAISAIKFFFRNFLDNDKINERHRPRHNDRLPVVLSKEEIGKVLDLEKNPKHRLLLMLAYSSGLRVSEVVALKREHIDLSRKVIYVKLGKGRKDRSTILSDKAALFIVEYCDFYGIDNWLFPGQFPNRPLTIRSAQHIFDKALRHAQIPKKISIHNLRHTFATHLLENGTDIRYIQDLLGHTSLRTTERYTRVARRSLLNIKSPLDTFP